MKDVGVQRVDHAPMLILVTGLPGTGKSSVASMIASTVGGAVLSHDWAMSGLRPYPEIQSVLSEMEPSGHRVVGWSILTALARSQLRDSRTVILDGVARSPEVTQCLRMALTEGTRLILVSTRCSDRGLHRSRIEGRERDIPNWYEFTWERVEQALDQWEEPVEPDLRLDSADPEGDVRARIHSYFSSLC
jgi:predicted kinase